MDKALQICRICLSVNVRMFIFKNTNMENMYKLLTQVDIDEDGKPTTVCFLCYARLRQCDRLQQQAIKSNELLKQFLKGGFMHATANALLNNHYSSQDLQVSSTYYLNLDPLSCEDVLLDPKVDVDSLISIKEEEVTIDEDNLTDFYEDANDRNNFAQEDIHSYSEDNQLSIPIGSNKCDRIKDIAQGVKWRKQQEGENLCIIPPKKEVENDPCVYISTQIEQKDSNEEAKGIHIKSDRVLENSFLTEIEKLQKNINNDGDAGDDIKSEEKIEKTKANIAPHERKRRKRHDGYTQNENINDTQTTVINSITDKYQCNQCGKEFSSKDILADHILNCKKTTEYLPSVSHPMKANTLKSFLGEMYRCDICTFKTSWKRSIETHLKMHSVTKVFTCDICEYRCAQKIYLKGHMSTHTGHKLFSCNICEYRSAHKHLLKYHMITHTGEKPFSCNICEYRCTQKHHLKCHIRIHTGEKPLSCNICEYKCVGKTQLKRHIRTHTGEKPFSCNICEYSCADKYYLKDHMRIHTGEKPFSCSICGYRCAHKHLLKGHMRIHAEWKPFSCNICEYRCTQKSYLKKHIRIHTGGKPFSCNICEYRCAQKRDLERHVRTHTGEKPFSCNICEYRCTKMPYLKAHLKTHK